MDAINLNLNLIFCTDNGTSSAWQAGWNVGNCMQGIGILSLPYTVKEGGTAALVTMAVVLLIGNYTSKVYTNSLKHYNWKTKIIVAALVPIVMFTNVCSNVFLK